MTEQRDRQRDGELEELEERIRKLTAELAQRDITIGEQHAELTRLRGEALGR